MMMMACSTWYQIPSQYNLLAERLIPLGSPVEPKQFENQYRQMFEAKQKFVYQIFALMTKRMMVKRGQCSARRRRRGTTEIKFLYGDFQKWSLTNAHFYHTLITLTSVVYIC